MPNLTLGAKGPHEIHAEPEIPEDGVIVAGSGGDPSGVLYGLPEWLEAQSVTEALAQLTPS